MASWFDILTFCATAAVFVGAIYAVRAVATSISNSINSTKESLKSRGVNVSATGVSVRTASHYSHEDYVDATQRGFIRAMNASGFSTSDNIDGSDSASPNGLKTPGLRPSISRHGSSASIRTEGSTTGPESEGKKRKHFGIGKRSKD